MRTFSYQGYTIMQDDFGFHFWKGGIDNYDAEWTSEGWKDNATFCCTLVDVMDEIAHREGIYHEVRVSRDIKPALFTSLHEALNFTHMWNGKLSTQFNAM